MADCIHPRFYPNSYDWLGRPVPNPCGVCVNCRINKLSSLEIRAKWELKNFKDVSFVRFSYDDYHLPYKPYGSIPTVDKVGWQDYLDKLHHYIKYHKPKNCDPNFKFLSCGEYGSDKNRPHCHAIFFGISPWLGRKNNPIFAKTWVNGFVQPLAYESGSIRYVLKYLEKSVNGELADSQFFDKSIEKPFVIWSKGLGSGFYLSQCDNIANYGSAMLNGKPVYTPPYYRNKYAEFSMERLRFIENRRLVYEDKLLTTAKFQGFSDLESYKNYRASVRAKTQLVKSRDNRSNFSLDDFNALNSERVSDKSFNMSEVLNCL